MPVSYYKITQFIYTETATTIWDQATIDYLPLSIIDLLHFPRFDSKILHFHTFSFIRVISLTTGKMAPILARATERTKNFSIFFLFFLFFIICRSLNFVKNQRIILYQIKNSQVVSTL